MVQHDLGRSVPFHIYHNMHAVAVGMVVDIGDALNALFLHQVGDILNQPCLVHLIGQFSDNDPVFSFSSISARARTVILPRPVA